MHLLCLHTGWAGIVDVGQHAVPPSNQIKPTPVSAPASPMPTDGVRKVFDAVLAPALKALEQQGPERDLSQIPRAVLSIPNWRLYFQALEMTRAHPMFVGSRVHTMHALGVPPQVGGWLRRAAVRGPLQGQSDRLGRECGGVGWGGWEVLARVGVFLFDTVLPCSSKTSSQVLHLRARHSIAPRALHLPTNGAKRRLGRGDSP